MTTHEQYGETTDPRHESVTAATGPQPAAGHGATAEVRRPERLGRTGAAIERTATSRRRPAAPSPVVVDTAVSLDGFRRPTAHR
jgi:hypothetical protein